MFAMLSYLITIIFVDIHCEFNAPFKIRIACNIQGLLPGKVRFGDVCQLIKSTYFFIILLSGAGARELEMEMGDGDGVGGWVG